MIVHCWKGRSEWIEETFGLHSEQWLRDAVAGYEGAVGATCMLHEDHGGDHDFVPDSDIIVKFKGPQP